MKVKLRYDYNYVDYDEKLNEGSYINFSKGEEYEVINSFIHPKWGFGDHTVYVIKNEEGDTMSISSEVVDIVD